MANVGYVVTKKEMLNHISECWKLAQKEYKIRHEWVGKVIHWELRKNLNFDHAAKWYMQKSEFVIENKTPKNSPGFWNRNRSRNPNQMTRPSDN